MPVTVLFNSLAYTIEDNNEFLRRGFEPIPVHLWRKPFTMSDHEHNWVYVQDDYGRMAEIWTCTVCNRCQTRDIPD